LTNVDLSTNVSTSTNVQERDRVSRVQLALNVSDVDAAVDFYSKLFATAPAKRKPGYANFAIDEPPLKLVLIENPGHGGSLNHLGVEVASTDEVVAATRRFTELGMPTRVEDGTTCCYALLDKVWVTGPGSEQWEVYTVLADAGVELEGRTILETPAIPAGSNDGACCTTSASTSDAEKAPASASACC
jgi:catechol 2,3-dioxygenase-like lactoylglutathione lyase family enzyme